MRTRTGARSVDSLICLCRALARCDQLEAAEYLGRRAVAVAHEDGSPNEAQIRARRQLGVVLRMRGQYDAAERELRAAARACPLHAAASALWLATWNELAVLYKYSGDFAAAERIYRGLYVCTLSEPEPCGETLATLLHNLGGLEHARGNYRIAERFARRSVVARTNFLGEGHPDIAADKVALAAILEQQGRLQAAAEIYQESLEVLRSEYGDQHSEIAVLLNNLASLAFRLGDAPRAERLFQRSLALKLRTLGDLHPDVALTMNNLAMVYHHQGRYGLAIRPCRAALRALEGSLGGDHPRTTTCRKNLAALEAAAGPFARISDPAN